MLWWLVLKTVNSVKVIVTFIVLLQVVSYVVVHLRCTGKGKIVLAHATEAYFGKGIIAPLIFKPLYYVEVGPGVA